jgi:peptide/nickel transport system ATP-binding protein
MYLGKIVELAPSASLNARPCHPYTQALLAAVPVPTPKEGSLRASLGGDVPSALAPPAGCSFHPRCPHRMEPCRGSAPSLREISPGHFVACYLHEDSPSQTN